MSLFARSSKISHLPTWWMRLSSKTVARAGRHLLGWPNPKALAGSIREQIPNITPQDRGALVALLAQHLFKPEYKDVEIDPYRLPPHFFKLVSEKRIFNFIYEVNSRLPGVNIDFVAGQFSIMGSDSSPPSGIQRLEADEIERPHSLLSIIVQVLNRTNRPLPLTQIRNEAAIIAKKEGTLGEEISAEEVSLEIGKLLGKEMLITTFAPRKEDQRYFWSHRIADVLEQTVYNYEGETGKMGYIYQRETDELAISEAAELETLGPDELTRRGKIVRIMDSDGSYQYMAANRFLEIASLLTSEIKASGKTIYYYDCDLRKLLEQRFLIRGSEDGSFIDCFIHHEAQAEKPYQIFNAFAYDYLRRHCRDDFERNYNLLRAAFTAGLQMEDGVLVPDFLYEAKTLAAMGAGLIAIAVALIKDPETIRLIVDKSLLASEIDQISKYFDRLAFVSCFPLLFTPEDPASLQDNMDFRYDLTETPDIFKLLLAVKIGQLRTFAVNEEPLPPDLRNEIELLYAPLAKSKGYIDLHNNMLDLVARIIYPAEYTLARERIEAEIGMDYDQARMHLAFIARELKNQAESQHKLPLLAVKSRVKETYSYLQKDLATCISPDALGIKFICKTIGELETIKAFLSAKLTLPPQNKLPNGLHQSSDRYSQPGNSGWKGWSGYFLDPSEKTAEKPRILRIQIQTEEMEKEDRLGKGVAHWSYKAERAARLAAQQMDRNYQKQIFDAAPVKEYTGNPEHDYFVDQARARNSIRTIVWPPHQEFSAENFGFPAGSQLSFLRLPAGQSIGQAIATASANNLRGNPFDRVRIYELYFDNKSGLPKVSLTFKKPESVLPGTPLPNAALMVFRT